MACFKPATRPPLRRGVASASSRLPLRRASASCATCSYFCIGFPTALRRVAILPRLVFATVVSSCQTTVAHCLGFCQWSLLVFVMAAALPVTGASTTYYAVSHCAVCLVSATRPALGVIGIPSAMASATATVVHTHAHDAHQSQTKARGTIRTQESNKWGLSDILKQSTHSRPPSWSPPICSGRGHRTLAKRSSLPNLYGRFVHVGSAVFVLATCLARGLLTFVQPPPCPQSYCVALSLMLPPPHIAKREMIASKAAAAT